jgi:hypothetical protein
LEIRCISGLDRRTNGDRGHSPSRHWIVGVHEDRDGIGLKTLGIIHKFPIKAKSSALCEFAVWVLELEETTRKVEFGKSVGHPKREERSRLKGLTGQTNEQINIYAGGV